MKVKELINVMRLDEKIEIREENNCVCLISKDKVIELFGDRTVIDFFITQMPVLDINNLKRIVINIKESEKG